MPPETPARAGAPAPQGRVAVVLVNYNGAADTLATLASLDACAPAASAAGLAAWRVIVVDNDSQDGSVARLRQARPDLEVIESGANRGFAGGNEVGIRRALADPEVAWVLLLNTDVMLDHGFLAPLVAACTADPQVAAAGPKIFYSEPPDRLWAAGGRLRWRETVTKELGRDRADGPDFNRPCDVTYLTTCCLLVTRRAFEQVGVLDPVFFINVEDADWCRRALDAGFRLRYVPQSRIWHKVAAASGGTYTEFKNFHTARGNAIYVRRHGGRAVLAFFLAVNVVALAAAWLRELRRRNTVAVEAKVRGLLAGLRVPLSPPSAGLAAADANRGAAA